MSDLANLWASLSRSARWSLVASGSLIIALLFVGAIWALKTPYGVLFSGLADRDAAVLVQELDKLKIPYQFSEDGKALMVPDNRVHKTRLALMAKPLPLHGAVGLELFNNADFGVSDFVQRINFLRAQQGELTRTILSIEQIENARVHLALPEQGLFRKDQARAKASITLSLKPGRTLAPVQVTGIQRLVSASVAEIQEEDVTVLDQSGTPLSVVGVNEFGGGGALGSARLELENHLTEKANKVLDQWLGPNQAAVSVTVALSSQQARVVKEEVIPATPAQGDQLAAGVLVRERNTTRDAPGVGDSVGGSRTGSGSSSVDRDYASGKRVEQTTIPAGVVNRLNVAVVVRQPMTERESGRTRELVAAAVGLQPERGDVLVLHSVDARSADHQAVPTTGPAIGSDEANQRAAGPSYLNQVQQKSVSPTVTDQERWSPSGYPALFLSLGAVFIALVFFLWFRLKSKAARIIGAARLLAPNERELVLAKVQVWMAQALKTEQNVGPGS